MASEPITNFVEIDGRLYPKSVPQTETALAKKEDEKDQAAVWEKEAQRLEIEIMPRRRALATRRETNPVIEQEAWEWLRHRVAGIAGLAITAIISAILGLIEAAGCALGYAVARSPLIVAPALGTFVASLFVQTYAHRGPLSWRTIQEFTARAAWVAFIVLLCGVLVFGIWHWFKQWKESG